MRKKNRSIMEEDKQKIIAFCEHKGKPCIHASVGNQNQFRGMPICMKGKCEYSPIE
jgi:hypothetical protein